LVRPGGSVFISTINRNLKSFLLAIVGAEYVMKLIPRGTHEYDRLIQPAELASWGRAAGLSLREVAGLFGVVLLLVLVATAASILATAGLGLIGFVPIVAVAVMPLQIAAWLLRGIVFQYLALTALGGYLTQYRHYLNSRSLSAVPDKRPA